MPQGLVTLQGSTMRHGQSLVAGDRIQLCFKAGKAVPSSQHVVQPAAPASTDYSPLPPQTPTAYLFIRVFCQVNFHPEQLPAALHGHPRGSVPTVEKLGLPFCWQDVFRAC